MTDSIEADRAITIITIIITIAIYLQQAVTDAIEAERSAIERRVEAQRRAQMEAAAARSRARRVAVECPGCGAIMAMRLLPKHMRDECENRKVPCKNFAFGCPCMVRVRDRGTHEDASHLMRPR